MNINGRTPKSADPYAKGSVVTVNVVLVACALAIALMFGGRAGASAVDTAGLGVPSTDGAEPNRAATDGTEPNRAATDGTEPAVFAGPAEATVVVSYPGEAQIRALQSAFPSRIQAVDLWDGEWALRIDGQWFAWAEGRLLPALLRQAWADYEAVRFYNYQLGPHQLPVVDKPTAQRLLARQDAEAAGTAPLTARHNAFLDTLYQAPNEDRAWDNIREVVFLGRRSEVHYLMVEPLARVDAEITALIRAGDESLRAFVRSLNHISGYHWRAIAGSGSRSYHSYGMAVDLIPRYYDGLFGYWRWALDSGIRQWWNLSLEERWNVPQAVVDAFERQGFVWGGKWLAFDPIHFEYRPEVILLARRRAAAVEAAQPLALDGAGDIDGVEPTSQERHTQ